MTSTTSLAGFAELYERHYEAVFRAALRVTGNPADAEDVLQTVFLRALARGGDVEDVALPVAYFKRAAVQPPVLLKEELRRSIATLDSDDATLFLLRHVEGLSIEELAGMFQIEK